MRAYLVFVLMLFVVSCGKTYDVYEPNGMGLVMEKMYDNLVQTRLNIQEGKPVGVFQAEDSLIFSEELTDKNINREKFNAFAQILIGNELKLYDAAELDKVKQHNQVVQSCLNCHHSIGCTGPIPKIEKLSIETGE